MRWFQYTVQDFENSTNPPNGAIVVLDRVDDPDQGVNYFNLSETGKTLCGLW